MSRNLRYAAARSKQETFVRDVRIEIMISLFLLAGFIFMSGFAISLIPNDNSRQPSQEIRYDSSIND